MPAVLLPIALCKPQQACAPSTLVCTAAAAPPPAQSGGGGGFMSGLGGMVMQGAIDLDQFLAGSSQEKVPGANQFMTRAQQTFGLEGLCAHAGRHGGISWERLEAPAFSLGGCIPLHQGLS